MRDSSATDCAASCSLVTSSPDGYYHWFSITVPSVDWNECILFGVHLSAETVVGTRSQFTFIQERFNNNKKAHILNTYDKIAFILRS